MRLLLILFVLAAAVAVAAQTSVTAVPTSPVAGDVVTVIGPDPEDLAATWTATGGAWCMSRACQWVSTSLTVPAYADPAYWVSTTAGTFTITHAIGPATASVEIVVTAAE